MKEREAASIKDEFIAVKKGGAKVIRLVKTIVRPLHRKLNLDILRRMKKEFWYTQLIMR